MSEDKFWTIVDTASGEVLAQWISPTHPRFHGFDWDGATMTAHETEAQGDFVTQSWNSSAHIWEDDPAKIDFIHHARIDAEAGAVRLRFITEIPGQQLIYAHKEAEARAYFKAIDGGETPDEADFPLLEADVTATGATIEEAATAVVVKADQWTAASAAIEAARLGAKRAVSAAETREAKAEAAAIDWEALLP